MVVGGAVAEIEAEDRARSHLSGLFFLLLFCFFSPSFFFCFVPWEVAARVIFCLYLGTRQLFFVRSWRRHTAIYVASLHAYMCPHYTHAAVCVIITRILLYMCPHYAHLRVLITRMLLRTRESNSREAGGGDREPERAEGDD